ncbi:hypothetical protein A5656_19955 [Mycobacterium gordonae]|jgi:hypothetical protein|uniref:hypothetical protein n=1 Tax=Mycobacterium paragordonae TaxID=1389713 RepID=UPI0007F03B5B|nr:MULTISPECIES: hypothetical protein [Mycobacterium]OBK56186.1 hypothetical protein A5656_19955 [Mycobacterium gordonae]
MSNQHNCRFDWCESDMNTCEAQRCEHFQVPRFVPATHDSLDGIGYTDRRPDHEDMPTIGVCVRFSEDLEPAPGIHLVIEGGRQKVAAEMALKIDEAVLLYGALGAAIQNACKGTNISPKRIAAHYSRIRND